MEKAVMSVRMKSWIKLLEEAAASGLPKGIWCDQNGINRRRFFYWQQKIREFVLEQHPELALSVPNGEIREMNNQIVSSLPVFCELKPGEPVSDEPENKMASAFSADAMIQYGNYKIFIGNSVSEKTLSTVLSVIHHA